MEHQLHSGGKLSLINGNVAPPRSVPTIKPAQVQKVADQLPAILQTTLLLEELLPLFEQQLQQIIHCDSFHFTHNGLNYHFDTADQRHHHCHYSLEMNGDYLGELTVTRRHKFSDKQIELLEGLLCQLVYPLRNCLLYRQALASALQDGLTGLGNRAAYESSLQREIELSHRMSSPLSMIVLDIDNFKAINDSYGHSSGDQALKLLANTISKTLRRSDVAFRYGGEEFVMLLTNTDLEAALIVAERVRIAVAKSLCQDAKHSFGFSVSLGVAQRATEEHGYHLFERADMALYQAKQNGRNNSVCAPTVEE